MDFYLKAQFDCIFMDIQMPAMKGDKKAFLAAKMNDFLPKPNNARELEKMLARFLSKA